MPNHAELGWRSLFGAWYVQDAIRLRPNLTLQVGLRQEFTTGWNEVSGRASNYITGPGGVLLTAPLVGDSVYTQNNAKHLFSPRVGLAWDPFGNQKTAVRAGFGTYYSLIDVLTFLVNSLPPYNGSASFTGSLPAILPITPNVPVPPSCGPGVLTGCTIYAPQGIQQDAKTPTVEEWNISVEQQLSRNMALRVAYVGSHGYHGLLSVDPNTIPPQICGNTNGCTAGGIGTTKPTVPQGTLYVPVQTAPAGCAVCSGRPNPYLAAGFFWFTEGNTSYNALASGLHAPPQQGFAVSRQLHVVEESGYEFGTDCRPGLESTANDFESEQLAFGLGTSGPERNSPVEYVRHLRSALRQEPHRLQRKSSSVAGK